MTTKRMIGLRTLSCCARLKSYLKRNYLKRVGISSKYLSSIERGNENPTMDTFIRLARSLNIEISELFNYSSELSDNRRNS